MSRFSRLIFSLSLFFPLMLFGHVILISDRCEFTDPDNFCPDQVKKKVFFQAPYRIREIDQEEWISSIQGKNTALILHGYNNDYEEALRFFSALSQKYGKLYDSFVCYLWPGGDHFWEYFQAKRSVEDLELQKELLQLTRNLCKHVARLDVMAHSMGCRLILDTLVHPSTVRINNMFLMAPAIDNESLEHNEIYTRAVKKCKEVFVFFSKKDGVLKWVYPSVEWDRSLGAHGAENPSKLLPSVHVIDSSEHIGAHNDYSDSMFVFQIIENTVKFGREGGAVR